MGLLAGRIRDESEVLVEVQHDETRQLGGCCDEQVGNSGSSVVSTIGQQLLDLDRAVLDGWREVLHGHGGQGRPSQTCAQFVAGPGAVPDLGIWTGLPSSEHG